MNRFERRQQKRRIIRELHPNQESYVERVVTFATQPDDSNTYGLQSYLGVVLLRLWLYAQSKEQPHKPRYQYVSEREQSKPLIDDRVNGVTLY